MLSLTPKNHIWRLPLAPICGRWWVLGAEKNANGENGKTKFPTLLGRIFARPISPNWYALFFFAFIAKSTSNSTQGVRKKILAFFGPPPEKKIFPGQAIIKITQTQEVGVFIS